MRLVFMGSPDFAVPSLNALADVHDIIAVYSQPPRAAGRGMTQKPTAVATAAMDRDIACHWPLSLKEPEIQAQLASHQADAFIVVAYGLLLPQAILDIPRFGCINGHASLLPRWRGPPLFSGRLKPATARPVFVPCRWKWDWIPALFCISAPPLSL